MGKASRKKQQKRSQSSVGGFDIYLSCGYVGTMQRSPQGIRAMSACYEESREMIVISKDLKAVVLTDALSLIDGCTLMSDTFGWFFANAQEDYCEWRFCKTLTANQEEVDFLLNGSTRRLHVAAGLGIASEVKRLIQNGWDLHADFNEDCLFKPLASAVRFCKAAENLRQVVLVLLDSGAVAEMWMLDECKDHGFTEAATLIEANLLAQQTITAAMSKQRSACRI